MRGMESGMGTGALRAWDAGPSAVAGALKGVSGGVGTAFPTSPAADMRTRSLAVRLFVARYGYGAARHVR